MKTITVILTDRSPSDGLRLCAAGCYHLAVLPTIQDLDHPIFIPLLCWNHIVLRLETGWRHRLVDTTLFPGFHVQEVRSNLLPENKPPFTLSLHRLRLVRAPITTPILDLQVALGTAYRLRWGRAASGLVQL